MANSGEEHELQVPELEYYGRMLGDLILERQRVCFYLGVELGENADVDGAFEEGVKGFEGHGPVIWDRDAPDCSRFEEGGLEGSVWGWAAVELGP